MENWHQVKTKLSKATVYVYVVLKKTIVLDPQAVFFFSPDSNFFTDHVNIFGKGNIFFNPVNGFVF